VRLPTACLINLHAVRYFVPKLALIPNCAPATVEAFGFRAPRKKINRDIVRKNSERLLRQNGQLPGATNKLGLLKRRAACP
jgi:hypothetical protein